MLYILIVTNLLLAAGGCDTPESGESEVPIWEQVKIGQIGPKTPGEPPVAKVVGSVYFEVYAIDLPAENVDLLSEVWEPLSAKPIRTNSYTAFADNGFRVRYGRLKQRQEIENRLAQIGAQGAGTTSLVLSEDEPADLPITDIPSERAIAFVGMNLSHQVANVAAGMLVLRLRAEPIPGARGVRKIVAYPVYTPGVAMAIPELEAAAKQREFYFAPAAFASQMSPGDFVLLAPNTYTAERQTLGGLFFNKASETVFVDPERKRPPERKPTVRLFVLLCTRMTE